MKMKQELVEKIFNAFPAFLCTDWFSFNMFLDDTPQWRGGKHYGHCANYSRVVCKRCVRDYYMGLPDVFTAKLASLGVSVDVLDRMPVESFLKLFWTLMDKEMIKLKSLGEEMYVFNTDIAMEKYTKEQIKGLGDAKRGKETKRSKE